MNANEKIVFSKSLFVKINFSYFYLNYFWEEAKTNRPPNSILLLYSLPNILLSNTSKAFDKKKTTSKAYYLLVTKYYYFTKNKKAYFNRLKIYLSQFFLTKYLSQFLIINIIFFGRYIILTFGSPGAYQVERVFYCEKWED